MLTSGSRSSFSSTLTASKSCCIAGGATDVIGTHGAMSKAWRMREGAFRAKAEILSAAFAAFAAKGDRLALIAAIESSGAFMGFTSKDLSTGFMSIAATALINLSAGTCSLLAISSSVWGSAISSRTWPVTVGTAVLMASDRSPIKPEASLTISLNVSPNEHVSSLRRNSFFETFLPYQSAQPAKQPPVGAREDGSSIDFIRRPCTSSIPCLT
mmetsp:Transcript_30708/g.60304  ORF Transcript_30708/g.60304 Transcript_30708/m.60304 type:complete len:213 (+) Transcript_30708:276-914(+)